MMFRISGTILNGTALAVTSSTLPEINISNSGQWNSQQPVEPV
jgi:hypothetical protein